MNEMTLADDKLTWRFAPSHHQVERVEIEKIPPAIDFQNEAQKM